MGILAGGFLVLFAVIWCAVLIPVSHSLPPDAQRMVGGMLRNMVYIGYALGGAGAVLLVLGLIKRGGKQRLAMEIMQRGTLCQGKVTFVDKDYSILVNNQPIFSTVEYTFVDSRGQTHTTRKTQVNSELVIRNRIEVGGVVTIKYLPEDPDKNALLMADAAALAAGQTAASLAAQRK